LDKNFKGLFGNGDDEEQEDNNVGSRSVGKSFMRSYGWIYQSKLIADFEGLKINEVYDLETLQCLNTLAYLKAKASFDREQYANK
jgi:hypothetical protein